MAPWRWCTADDGRRVHGEILLWVLERAVGRGVLDREGVCANHALKVFFLGRPRRRAAQLYKSRQHTLATTASTHTTLTINITAQHVSQKSHGRLSEEVEARQPIVRRIPPRHPLRRATFAAAPPTRRRPNKSEGVATTIARAFDALMQLNLPEHVRKVHLIQHLTIACGVVGLHAHYRTPCALW